MYTGRHMKRSFAAIITTVVLATIVPSLSAQWPAYVPPGTPTNADGKPNLDAPAPRTPDGKPDLNGIWNNGFGAIGGVGRGRGTGPTLPADGSPPLATFFNVGAGFPDGLPFQPWAKAEL